MEQPVRFTINEDASSKPKEATAEDEKNLRNKSLELPKNPEVVTTLAEVNQAVVVSHLVS